MNRIAVCAKVRNEDKNMITLAILIVGILIFVGLIVIAFSPLLIIGSVLMFLVAFFIRLLPYIIGVGVIYIIYKILKGMFGN